MPIGSFMSMMMRGGPQAAVSSGLQNMSFVKPPSSLALGQARGSSLMPNKLGDLASNPPEMLLAEKVKNRTNRGRLA